MKKIKFQERPDFWIPFLLYAGLLLFKLVFIIDNRSMPVISDEFRYVRFARSLLEKGSYHSTQYPLAYPLALIPAFLMGSHFYTAIKVLNAVYSSFVPVLMYAIARLYLKPKESAVCGFFSAILPFHYVTVMSIMSENLYFPLFLLAIYVLLKDHPRHKIGADVLLGFLIGACYLTRHVTLVTIPVFALVWFVKQLDEKEKIPVIFLRGFLIVGVMGLTYSPWLIMCVREGLTIKNALGFSIASKTNPEQLTMPRLAQSCMLYVSYIVLGSAPCIGFALKALRGFEWKRLFETLQSAAADLLWICGSSSGGGKPTFLESLLQLSRVCEVKRTVSHVSSGTADSSGHGGCLCKEDYLQKKVDTVRCDVCDSCRTVCLCAACECRPVSHSRSGIL